MVAGLRAQKLSSLADFQSRLHQLAPVWPWVRYSMSLEFFICRMGIMWYLPHGWLWVLKYSVQCLAKKRWCMQIVSIIPHLHLPSETVLSFSIYVNLVGFSTGWWPWKYVSEFSTAGSLTDRFFSSRVLFNNIYNWMVMNSALGENFGPLLKAPNCFCWEKNLIFLFSLHKYKDRKKRVKRS